MADVNFTIGAKDYTVSTQDGEEQLLARAAGMLDEEAQKILGQAGRMPEQRLLLLAGLMLADRLAHAEDRAIRAEADLRRAQAHPERIEVPVIPPDLRDALNDWAAQAEALADRLEDQVGR